MRGANADTAVDKKMLLIIGCQRSGTTLVTRIFERDLNTKVYPEHSEISDRDQLDGLRLNHLETVQQTIAANPFPFTVLKPLVETQNAPVLLDFFSQAKALWMFRHYTDVANSNLQRFGMGNGIKNLRFIAQRVEGNWRYENTPPEMVALVDKYFAEDMNPYDAAALFWIVRNQFFFEYNLGQNPRVLMCRYSDLVTKPNEMVGRIYDFVGQKYPGERLVSEVNTASIGKGRKIDLSPEIEALCDEMLARLEAAYQTQEEAFYARSS